MLVESLELDLDTCRLHDFVDLSVLFSADELAVFIRQLDLETYLVMKHLNGVNRQ